MYKCINKNCDGSLSGIILGKTPFVQCNLCKTLYRFDVEPKTFEGLEGILNIIIIDKCGHRHQIDKIESAGYKEWYNKFFKIKELS
jgi:hypothetical protein